MNFKTHLRRLVAAIAAMMILVTAAQAEAYIVTAKSAKLYGDEACTWNIAALPRATVVNLESSEGGVAKITVKDREGYVSASEIRSIAGLAKAATVNRSTYAYQSASIKSKSFRIKKGTQLNVLATSGSWVMVERNGAIAYMNKAHVTLKAATEQVEPETEIINKQVVINRETYVYQKASTSAKKLKVKKGMKVTLVSITGEWAKVQNGSAIAYIDKDYLDEIKPEEDQDDPVTEPDEKDENGTTLVETFSAKVTADSLRIHENASTSAETLTSAKKGTILTVYAYNSNGWAYVELDGKRGYAQISGLERVDTSIPEVEPTQKPASKDYINDESLSVEKRIFLFLTNEVGLNTAGACGILANIEKESSFRVNAGSSDGGYGLVQWTGGRCTRLKTWCADNGYDHATLEGQLWFLKYELEGSYKKILNYIKDVSNTPAGAYDSGYYFCYHYEIPANRAARSVTRGNLAKDTYWQKYAS